MKARAPGKIVVSGAYAVLSGSPAVVAAVDRYVLADTGRHATFVTPEVREALGDVPAPAFDADALRDGARKLGLGSSAAIVVASLAAVILEQRGRLEDPDLCRAVLEPALRAHARAQGGGSGIDVAASAHGGVLRATRGPGGLEIARLSLPPALVIEIWAAGESASTPELLGRVSRLRERDRATHDRLLSLQGAAAERAAVAWQDGDADAIVEALQAQAQHLGALGRASDAPIITPAVARLAACASAEGAAVLPAGAGGGDIALFVGRSPPSPALRALLTRECHRHLVGTQIGARGVHAMAD